MSPPHPCGGKYATRVDAVEDLLRSDTVGLVSAADFRAKRQFLERCAADVAEVRAAAARREEVDARQARLAKRADGAKLSFAFDDEDGEEDDDDDDDDDGGGGSSSGHRGTGTERGRRRVVSGAAGRGAPAHGGGGGGSPSEGAGSGGGGDGGGRSGAPDGAGAAAAAAAVAAPTPAGAAGQVVKGKSPAAAAAAPPSPGRGLDAAVLPPATSVTAVAAAAAAATTGSAPPPAKRVKVGKNPTADTSFLPDRSRTVAAAAERARLAQAWHNEQAAAKAEPVTITYSYWDGRGHRRTLTCPKGTTIGKFLALVQTQFHALRAVSPDQLMFVKEDLIIPSHYSFHDFIVRKARGKSGPLFTFDVVEDVRLVNDASVEKADAHAGKVVERRWYERNRHIFPASRWEPWDPNKVYEQYTIHGA